MSESGGDDRPLTTYEAIAFSLQDVWMCDPRHALFQDHEDAMVVTARLLDQAECGAWLISVEGRVYEVDQQMLRTAVDWAEDAGLVKLADGDEDGDGDA